MEAPASNEVRQRRFVRERETPPEDDICPICFSNYNIPCKTNCGHWFCANCILMFWRYSADIHPCKCPMCSQSISKLTPMASLTRRQEGEIVEALDKVKGYNHIYDGSPQSLTMKLQRLPLLFRRLVYLQLPILIRQTTRSLMDPDQMLFNYMIARIVAFSMTVFYELCGFGFIPGGFLGETIVFEVCTVGAILVAQAFSIYRSIRIRLHRRRARRARPVLPQ